MKRYLLGLRSGDFNKTGNKWVTNPINVYNNSFYKNYSYKRSKSGLNLIDDFTFVGTEVSSPSYDGNHSTPVDANAIYKTNYGEVVYETATPDLLRFIDYTSRVDVISYKSAFTNLPGTEIPTFTVQFYESDNENGPWLRSVYLNESNAVFLKNCKQYIKIELEIFSELENYIENIGLLFYVELAIQDPIVNTITDSARNIARRFPTWTEIYEDSLERATPELATPVSNAGKLISSLVGEYLDDFSAIIDENNLDSYISTLNEDIIDWLYVSYNIPAAGLNVIGDGISLAKAPSLEFLYNSKKTDYIYYHNLLDSQSVTLRKFDRLVVDGTSYSQEPSLLSNRFDEFGARVNLPRLYLENNSNYRKRILDVYLNPPNVGIEGYKRTLRRELDIWRSYGSTPDSYYLGATPEIIEISDIEGSTPYFNAAGNPQDKFIEFVKYINETYPSNLGYVSWDEGIWDYAGLQGDGVGRIPASYDTATPLSFIFQPGVGDFRDAQLVMPSEVIDSATTSFNGYFKADGFKVDSYNEIYGPITVGYSYHGGYSFVGPDPYADNPDSSQSNNGGIGIVYEVSMPPHGDYATPAVYYANISYENNNSMFVYNYYPEDSSASPEYNFVSISNSDNLTNTDLIFREKTYNYIYTNYSSTPNNSSLDLSKASSISIKNRVRWDHESQSYVAIPGGSYRISFNEDQRGYIVPTTDAQTWSLSTPNINYVNANLKVGSTVYAVKDYYGITDINTGQLIINDNNELSQTSNEQILIQTIKDSLLFPIGSTPTNIYINNEKVNPYPLYKTIQTQEIRDPEYGGIGYNPLENSNYFIPSSPNIAISTYTDPQNLSSPTYTDFFTSATINYNSSVQTAVVSSKTDSKQYYPFLQPVWVEIGQEEAKSTPMINGYMDHFGNVYKNNELIEDSGRSYNSKIVDRHLSTYSLSRETFGILPENTQEYIVTKITPISNNSNVTIYSDKTWVEPADSLDDIITIQASNSFELIQEIYNSDSQNYYFSDIEIYAEKISNENKKTNTSLESLQPHLHTGWLFLPEEDYYIYSKPVEENYFGKFFEIELTGIPRSGAPVLVTLTDEGSETVEQYKELIFTDSATPGKAAFFNTEQVVAGFDKSIYLANTNLYNVTVKDLYTGKVLKEEDSSISSGYYVWTIQDTEGNYIWDADIDDGYYIISIDYSLIGNKLQILDSETLQSVIIPGREYEITYTVDNSFYVDKNVYDAINDEYKSYAYFASTPAYDSNYQIIYETAIEEFSTPSGIMLNALENPLDEGFIYITETEYDFEYAEIDITPSYIGDNLQDFTNLIIKSFDYNGNPKPNQSFSIQSDLLTPEDSLVTTNEYGFSIVKLTYSGPIPAVVSSTTVTISGLDYDSATPSSGINVNSSALGYSKTVNVEINRAISKQYVLKAAPHAYVMQTDAESDNTISGYILDNNSTLATPVSVYWRKARSVYSGFEDVDYSTSSSTPGRYGESGYVLTDSSGRFNIGPFYSQDRSDPGYWFIIVDTEMSSTPSATPVTIAGDVVYWYERYDNIHYENEVLPRPYEYRSLRQENAEFINRPNFAYNYYDLDYDNTSSATVNWLPPKWLPVNYYEQYQMGLFGSTVNYVATYDDMMNNYEED
jgi:hypothetical protein